MKCLDIATIRIILSRQRTTKGLIRLRGCVGWSVPLLFVYGINRFSHEVAHAKVLFMYKKAMNLSPGSATVNDRSPRIAPSGSAKKNVSTKCKHRGSYTSGHFIWNLWKEASASCIHFIWNDHECKVLFIIWLLKLGYYRLKRWHYFYRKHNVVTGGIMTLRVSNQVLCNQVLCNVWSYDFYDMTLATK